MYVIQPEVELVTWTDLPLETIYTAFRQCYYAGDIHQFSEDAREGRIAEEMMERLVERCVDSGHESAIEHVSFTFAISGVSRALSHQFVRHRIASYSQQSQRYCSVTDLGIVMPDFSYLSDVQKNLCETAVKEFGVQVEEAYAKLKDFGAKNEDARAVLPNCASTSFMVTMNCRSLLNFFRHRCCYRAQTEIRDVAWAMLEQVRVQLPVVFAKAGPRCMMAKRCLEDKPCGMNPWKVKHEEVTQL